MSDLNQILLDRLTDEDGLDTAKRIDEWLRGNVRCDRCKHSSVGGLSRRLYCSNPDLDDMVGDYAWVKHDHYCKEFSR